MHAVLLYFLSVLWDDGGDDGQVDKVPKELFERQAETEAAAMIGGSKYVICMGIWLDMSSP